MSEKKIHWADTIHYSLVQGSYFIAFCAIVSCATVYLLQQDFSSGTVGVILAVANLISIATQPLLADFIDRRPQVPLRNAAALLSMLAFLALLGLLFCRSQVLIAFLYFFVALIEITLQPFVNTLGVAYRDEKAELNFGAARAMGSLVFSATSFFVGQLAVQIGGISVIVVSLGGTLLFALMALSFRKTASLAEAQTPKSSPMSEFIRRHRRFMVLLAGLTLACSSHMLTVTFLLPIVQRLGAGSQEMGIALFLSGILEIPAMFLFRKINLRFSSAALLKIACAAYVLKTGLIAAANRVEIVYLAQILQMFSYALFIPASVRYADSVIEEKDRAKGQACVGIALSASGVIGCFFGGLLVDSLGINAALVLGTGLAALGTAIVFAFVDPSAG